MKARNEFLDKEQDQFGINTYLHLQHHRISQMQSMKKILEILFCLNQCKLVFKYQDSAYIYHKLLHYLRLHKHLYAKVAYGWRILHYKVKLQNFEFLGMDKWRNSFQFFYHNLKIVFIKVKIRILIQFLHLQR